MIKGSHTIKDTETGVEYEVDILLAGGGGHQVVIGFTRKNNKDLWLPGMSIDLFGGRLAVVVDNDEDNNKVPVTDDDDCQLLVIDRTHRFDPEKGEYIPV